MNIENTNILSKGKNKSATPEPYEVRIKKISTLRHENMPFDIDVWYPLVKDITFPTFYVPLTLEEAIAMVHYFETRYKSMENMTYDDTYILLRLEHKINFHINHTPVLDKKGCFVRLCGRSPKDGDPMNPKQELENHKKKQKQIMDALRDEFDYNGWKISAIAKCHWLKVCNGKEVLSLLLTSERVWEDLRDWIRNGGMEQIVLRQWVDFDYDNEYRAFVYNNKLTAISQYDHYGKYYHLVKDREKNEKILQEFWEKNVKDKLVGVVSNYICDLCMFDDGKVMLIELSPFLESTGASLYNWKRDGKILKSGDGKLKVNENDYIIIDELCDEWIKRYEQIVNFQKYYYFPNRIQKMYMKIMEIVDFIDFFGLCKQKPIKFNLLVVGVLKKGFYWSNKYLNCLNPRIKLIGDTLFCNDKLSSKEGLNKLSMVVDENGMCWLCSGESDSKIKGEVWEISGEELVEIHFFLGKNRCTFKKTYIPVNVNGKNKNLYVGMFVRNEAKKEGENIISEYDLEMQKSKFNPIKFLVEREEKYLEMSYDLH